MTLAFLRRYLLALSLRIHQCPLTSTAFKYYYSLFRWYKSWISCTSQDSSFNISDFALPLFYKCFNFYINYDLNQRILLFFYSTSLDLQNANFSPISLSSPLSISAPSSIFIYFDLWRVLAVETVLGFTCASIS